MGEILFLAHRIPFPPDRGDKIRSHHLLRALAAIAPVHVATFGETDADMLAELELAAVAASHRLVRRTKPLNRAGIEALLFAKPVSLTAFDHQDLRTWIARVLSERPIDTIFVFSGQMGQYIPPDFAGRVVVDLCDVDSAKFEAYAEKGHPPRSIIDRREGKLLAKEESCLAARAERVLLVSANEAALFRGRIAAPMQGKVAALRNGIDARFFDPEKAGGESPFDGQVGPHLVFTGQMDYPPNIAAVTRVARSILPEIRKTHPDARFHIVGRAPTEQVRRLGQISGVEVWGEVPDVRPYLAHCDVVLAPLMIARGIQNKVLEAMAMARPVVLSPEAANGIDGGDGEHFLVGRDDAALTGHILDLLADPQRAGAIGLAAREYVVAHQSWEAMLKGMAAIVGREPENEARRVA
ncbi:TIGR03087 family PEP-CTERM/XrtA system glycosyltransferase [Parerythrobacter lacustris]|uniref:TIGR03087 family PEP-CTERM/XrtA system glycosyltransferase n=1 Tax=Parerythrobacter lacustris TaxID=2969984 RepID=A0ABT1XPX6_9SPHN|nr:TIGR03087 family PEP-CTERM/XrtA system glycosyltransferase [Parerythrobacter lacustris]MCR2833693.1 TIGR03087 family PEP-CTERM/XrtA system glycosyltransferase [Parerythrobacter lacustris]